MKPGPKPRIRVKSSPELASKRMPRNLSAEAQRFWHAIVPELVRLRLVSVLDIPGLILLCEAGAIARQAFARVDAEGVVVDGYRNAKRKHPALQVARDFSGLYLKLGREFGVTPSSRLEVEPEDAEDIITYLFTPLQSEPKEPAG